MLNKILNKTAILLLLPLMSFIVLFCTQVNFEPYDPYAVPKNSCEGCHIDYERLQEVHSPDTAPPPGGCGGDAPHYEPYDRVYMGGQGYEQYKSSGHYQVGCTTCHGGTDNVGDKNLAHSGDFINHPSLYPEEKCGTCHKDISEHYTTSIHTGVGQKRKVTLRSGLSGPSEFDKLPAHQIEGYNANCSHCHGTCGNCHVVRPATGGGGLSNGHMFNKTPDMLSVCVTCHTSRGGHAYLGVAPGTKPDVHLTKAGFECLNCHNGAELHGDGSGVEQRYAYEQLPSCENCHTSLDQSNDYHTVHLGDFSCYVCHSQDYNNCGSCHVHGEGARVPSYLDYKIALNPLPDIKTGEKFSLVRRTLAAPDNWNEYHEGAYSNFDTLPTYNYTTPHNILKWTARTTVESGKGCGSECHVRKENGVLVNTENYLYKSDLEFDWEIPATEKICVDGKLPSSWPTK